MSVPVSAAFSVGPVQESSEAGADGAAGFAAPGLHALPRAGRLDRPRTCSRRWRTGRAEPLDLGPPNARARPARRSKRLRKGIHHLIGTNCLRVSTHSLARGRIELWHHECLALRRQRPADTGVLQSLSRWEIVGNTGKRVRVRRTDDCVGGSPSLARGLSSDRRMPRLDRATGTPRNDVSANEENQARNCRIEHMSPGETR
jgi:hypothetical protein